MVEKEKGLGAREGEKEMTTTVVAAIVMTPIILLPVAFVGYLTIGGIYGAIKGTGRVPKKAVTPA
jgi:hypothetical protein